MLEVFFKQFNAHASEPDSFLSSNDVKNIFSCAEIILSYNRELLNNLEIVLKNWDPKLSKIGEVFSSMVDFLKIYSAYVSNYTTALNTLEKCKKDPQFLQMLQEAEKDQRLKNMPLSGFLIMPVQRIPRYLMLIRELLKYTPPDHIDYDSLSKTQDRIATVALEVNEAERIASNLQTVYQIQRVFGPQIETIVEPHRRLVKHGKVTLIEKNHKKNRKEAYLILFNDMVILAKQKGDGLDKLVKTPKIDDIDPMEEGTSKVILQIDIAKVTLMMEGEVQFILKTDKNKFLFEFENQNKLIEWSSKFQETKDKYTERLPKT
uniref:DH domain-containing protein n=1 Tax=Arcella intermedia TaxID=1963864 RepID=A0A6B2L7W0_9EUKA